MKPLKRLYDFPLLPWMVVFIGIVFAGVIAWKSNEWILKAEKERFTAICNQTTSLVQKKIELNVQLLLSAAAFVDAADTISEKEWTLFEDRHASFEYFSGLRAIGYAPRTPEGFINSSIGSATQNKKLFTGLNVTMEPIRKRAAYEALQREKVSITDKVDLLQEENPSEKAGFLIYAPIYNKGMSMSTEKERMEASKGLVYAVMAAKRLFEDILDSQYTMIHFEIYDGTAPMDDYLLYDTNPTLKLPRLEKYTLVEFYGKKWTMYFKTNAFLDMDINRYVPFVEFLFGSILSIIVGLWIYALQRTRQEAYAIATEKTRKLLASEAQTRTIFQVMQEGIILHDNKGVIVECNLAVQDILGTSMDNIVGRTGYDPRWKAVHEDGTPFDPKDRPAAKVLRTKEAQRDIVMGINREDGVLVWILANAQPIFSDDFEEVISVVVTISDISILKASKYQLEQYIEIIDANVMITSTDCEGNITEASEAFCKISGYTKEELVGQNQRIVRHPDTPRALFKEMWIALRQGLSWRGEIKNRCKDGSFYWVDTIVSPRYNEESTMVGYTAIRQDITDKKRIEELAITDTLTGLYNRLKLDELFALHLSVSKRHGSPFSVIMLDIDKFKSVNDIYGHQVGDMVLKEVAALLKSSLRFEDALGRWGGEEFLILLPSTMLNQALVLAELLRGHMQKKLFAEVGTKTISLGVASFHQGDDAKSIIRRADEALYRAKANGRNRVEVELYNEA